MLKCTALFLCTTAMLSSLHIEALLVMHPLKTSR